jgi:predicted amidophosphoribosyltransferase
MRNRHVPRLCHECRAPMSSSEDGCWRCGARWEIATTHDDHESHHPLDSHSAQDAEERVLVGAGRS